MKNNTKLIALLISPLVIFYACTGSKDKKADKETNIQLSGKLSHSKAGSTVKLIEITPEETHAIDSIIIDESGEFSFSLQKENPGFYRLNTGNGKGVPMILKPGDKAVINGDFLEPEKNYTVTGSDESIILQTLNKSISAQMQRIDSLKKLYGAGNDKSQAYLDSIASSAKPSDKNFSKLKESLMILQEKEKQKLEALAKSLDKPYQEIKIQMDDYIRNFIISHKTSITSLAIINSLNPEKNISVYQRLDSALFAAFPNSPHVKDFHERVAKLAHLSNGSSSPELEIPGTDGKPIKLSSLKGKYVLVDFWASWCGPCRQENPNNVRLYNQYKNKGFEIYGVSLDREKEAWLKAIKDDKLSWIHVSDLEQWNSPVVKMFDIEGIPYTLLLDKEGKIIAKGLRGRALELKLKEILG